MRQGEKGKPPCQSLNCFFVDFDVALRDSSSFSKLANSYYKTPHFHFYWKCLHPLSVLRAEATS